MLGGDSSPSAFTSDLMERRREEREGMKNEGKREKR